jgi:hypothetical protein
LMLKEKNRFHFHSRHARFAIWSLSDWY